MSCTAELLAVSQITPGQTYSPVYKTVVAHGTWSAALWRRYYRESRNTVVYSLENLFKEALLDPTNYPMIEKALQGCRNLQITYKDDCRVVEKLDQIIVSTNAAMVDTQNLPSSELIQIQMVDQSIIKILPSPEVESITQNSPSSEIIQIEMVDPNITKNLSSSEVESITQIPSSSKVGNMVSNSIQITRSTQEENSPLSYNDMDILTTIINRILDEIDGIHRTLDEILNNICSGAGSLAIEIREFWDKFPNSKN